MYFSHGARVHVGKEKIRQFEAILFIMDETGFITTFAIARDKSLSSIEPILMELAARSPHLRTICTGTIMNNMMTNTFLPSATRKVDSQRP
jgi:hypothetical protein